MRAILENRSIDLILMDIRLPGEDGLTLAREIRKTSMIPIIMLTAKGDVIDRVAGLESGADDYLPKPFELRELLARTNAVLRRSRSVIAAIDSSPRRSYFFKGWCLNAATRQLFAPDKEEVHLSPAEFDLLNILLRFPQRVLSRETLLDLSRGRSATPFERTIDVRIAQLRKKFDRNQDTKSMIKTIRNAGYMIDCSVDPVEE